MKCHDVGSRKKVLQRDEAQTVPGSVCRGRPCPPEQRHSDAGPQPRHVGADGSEPTIPRVFPLRSTP